MACPSFARPVPQIYQARGVPRELAEQVAVALHEDDPVQAHLRDELGTSIGRLANVSGL
jgi:hypothetical protein